MSSALPAASWSVSEAEAGERLDRHVASRYGVPRNQVQGWIRDGLVRIGGAVAKPATAVGPGDRIECEPPVPREERIVPEAAEIAVLHEDAAIVVLDKPPGLAVHPGAGRATGTLAHRLLARFPEMAGVGGPGRPGIVHRLDKDTSGVMVVARTAAAYQALSRAFAGREVAKRYLAIGYGRPAAPKGTIEAPIGRHPERRKEMAVLLGAPARPARTGYRAVATAAGITLFELDLATGRTHQIRVHLKHLGHPLVGDPVYGEARWRGLPRSAQGPLAGFPRPALHAWRLAFRHPESGEEVRFEAPVPADMRELWERVTGERWPDLTAEGDAATRPSDVTRGRSATV